MTAPRVLLYVQNLLGIGHLRRAAAVARALDASGAEVTFVSGGVPVPSLPLGGARLLQLPPVRTEESDFKTLVDETGQPIDDRFRDHRRDLLLQALDEIQPDAVITELFPFGRRQMRFELLPFLEAATTRRPKPVICASMRDILIEKPRADRNREIVDTVKRFYDAVLVHADPALIRLEETFSMTPDIHDWVRYTGYVVNPPDVAPPDQDPIPDGEVLVSVGGGAVGANMLRAVVDLQPSLPLSDRPWRIVAGHHVSDADYQTLQESAASNVTLERFRPDLPALMGCAALSISQAGYNTLLEVLATGVRSVVVPFETEVETEQRLRTDLLVKRGVIEAVAEADLATGLAGAIERALARPWGATPSIDMAGAGQTADVVLGLIRDRVA